MLNLAPWKYRAVMESQGGPVRDLLVAKLVSAVDGHEYWEAFATLNVEFEKKASEIYGSGHGSGSAKSVAEARYRAISEAMDRWAFFESSRDRDARMGFDVDCSTTGMAAFPGLFPRQARQRAMAEAIERWVLNAWWARKLNHHLFECPLIDTDKVRVEGLQIDAPWNGHHIVVLWVFEQSNGFWTYGFAAENSREGAIKHAMVELERNIRVLRHYYLKNERPTLRNMTDLRLHYFSTHEGHHAFLDIVRAPVRTLVKEPRMLIDTEIRGPWTQYAHVWRCLFEPAAIDSHEEINFFAF
jgi:hypothetical protein